MAFESPSERVSKSITKFIFLRHLDGRSLGRRTWYLVLSISTIRLILQILGLIEIVSNIIHTSAPLNIYTIFAISWAQISNICYTLIYVLMLRLAIEVALSMFDHVPTYQSKDAAPESIS